MSIRAYRVIEIKMADPSFDVWHDKALMNFLDAEALFFDGLSDSGGMADVPINVLKRAMRVRAKLHLSEEIVAHLKQDIAAAESAGDELVTYYCF